MVSSIAKIITLYLALLAPLALVDARASKNKAAVEVVAPKRELSGSEMAAAGAFATAFGVVIMHPVDTIKTLQQSAEGAGLNMVQASSRIMKNGGMGAMYSGLGPYVTADGMAGALKFASYEYLKKVIKDKVPEEHYGKALYLAGAAAFLASSVVLVPGELLKQRLQMGQISSVRSGIPQILKSEGFFGLYAGYSGVCLRDVPYTMMELGIYDNLKEIILKVKGKSSGEGNQWDDLLAAAVSGGFTGFLTAPLDNIKTKLMLEKGYSGFFDCLSKTVKTGGMGGLFAGSAARVAWLMPFTAIYLPVYEILKRKMEMSVPSAAATGALAVKGGAQLGQGMNPVFGVGRQGAVPGGRRPAPVMKSLKMKSTRFAGSACF
jgi:solute carrier family 25 S-adenosylmethionine transporter 26